jgi:hypothetical protein
MVPANVPLGNKHGRLLRHNFGNHASQGWMSSRDESLNDEKFDMSRKAQVPGICSRTAALMPRAIEALI